MLPYLLIAAGAYLVGQSRKNEKFAKGGVLDDGQTDEELYSALTEMGYDYGEYGSDDFDSSGFSEMAINLGYRWDEKKQLWFNKNMADGGETKGGKVKDDGQTDEELYSALTEMGYDYGEYGSDDFDSSGFSEMAINLGYRWDEKKQLWFNKNMADGGETKGGKVKNADELSEINKELVKDRGFNVGDTIKFFIGEKGNPLSPYKEKDGYKIIGFIEKGKHKDLYVKTMPLKGLGEGPTIDYYRIIQKMAHGGETHGFKFLDGGDGVEYEIWEKDGVRYRVPIERDEDVEGEYEELIIYRYFEDAEPMDMAKGGETKWIQKAIKKPGSLRAEAKREGLIEGEEKLSKTDLKKLEKKGGKTARRARLAQTLKTLK